MKTRYARELSPEELAALPDEEIDTSDIPELGDEFLRNAKLVMPAGKAAGDAAHRRRHARLVPRAGEGLPEQDERGAPGLHDVAAVGVRVGRLPTLLASPQAPTPVKHSHQIDFSSHSISHLNSIDTVNLKRAMPRKMTPQQKAAIISRLREGRTPHEIAAEVGVSLQQVRGIMAHITIGTYSGDEVAPAELEDAREMKFGLERDLQQAIRRNIDQLESGLEIIDGGKERSLASGRIDVTARDERGATVVIELKADTADHNAVSQIQSYMGDLIEDEKQVRGILVARDFTHRAVSAARLAPVQLVRYGVQFTFRAVGGSN